MVPAHFADDVDEQVNALDVRETTHQYEIEFRRLVRRIELPRVKATGDDFDVRVDTTLAKPCHGGRAHADGGVYPIDDPQ